VCHTPAPRMANEASLEATVRRTLAEERVRNQRRISFIRACGLIAVLALALILGLVHGAKDWEVYLTILGPYAALSVFVAIGTYTSKEVARWASLMMPLVDVPVVYTLQSLALPLSPSPGFALVLASWR